MLNEEAFLRSVEAQARQRPRRQYDLAADLLATTLDRLPGHSAVDVAATVARERGTAAGRAARPASVPRRANHACAFISDARAASVGGAKSHPRIPRSRQRCREGLFRRTADVKLDPQIGGLAWLCGTIS